MSVTMRTRRAGSCLQLTVASREKRCRLGSARRRLAWSELATRSQWRGRIEELALEAALELLMLSLASVLGPALLLLRPSYKQLVGGGGGRQCVWCAPMCAGKGLNLCGARSAAARARRRGSGRPPSRRAATGGCQEFLPPLGGTQVL